MPAACSCLRPSAVTVWGGLAVMLLRGAMGGGLGLLVQLAECGLAKVCAKYSLSEPLTGYRPACATITERTHETPHLPQACAEALSTQTPVPAVQGALLLVLFQTSHVVEHLLTHKAQGNLLALYDAMPTSASLVSLNPGGAGGGGGGRWITGRVVPWFERGT